MDVDRISSILLQTFLTVAEAGQISEAARRLHLSQPTVTGHIRRLEGNLETTLFIRSANGVSLTERGAVFGKEFKTSLPNSNRFCWSWIGPTNSMGL
jgi:DNA-binding transcriptional LysR family regulator